ncbi:MAG TPA: hypothetical protein VKG01_14300 [Thermoanaerobaculia bacterium]|nr:hypothetical protein [Thermoanaerobaculia bacterium]
MADLLSAPLDVLANLGLLLVQDKTLPNVVTIVTGDRVAGSWWSHPKGRLVFAVVSRLEDHPDVVFTKLVNGKVTLVHRRLWPALAAVGSAREPWQLDGLSAAARRLLGKVDRSGEVRVAGAPVKELERKLLVHSEQVHTESGRHETRIEPWSAWARRVGIEPLRSAAGRQLLEKASAAIGAPSTALPWRAIRAKVTPPAAL